jgi:hypothetical protein
MPPRGEIMPREIKATSNVETSVDYTGKHTLTYKDSSHRYSLDGKPCTSVTTFNKAAYPTSIGLINFFKRQTSIALFDTLSTLRFGTAWPTTEEEKTNLFKSAEKAHEEVSQEAADIGTITHKFIELYSLGHREEAESLLAQLAGVPTWELIKNCTDKARLWSQSVKREPYRTEVLCASVKHLFCGRLDRLDIINGRLRIQDYKTSKSIYLDQFIQMATYIIALEEWLGIQVKEMEVVRFGKEDGAFETLLISDPKEIEMFKQQALRNRETFEFMKMSDDPRFDWRKR